MSKAVEGAGMLLGAVAMGVAAFMDPALLASPLFDKVWASLIIGGISMEAGAIAGALMANRGMEITTRQTAAARQVIYGQQRVGGVIIYKSTTGSHHDQFNYVIVLAGHVVDSIQNLYLDGRQVHWQGSGPGYSIRNGVGFGGVANSNSYTGPNGVQYNFGGTGHSGIYCEARYGDQLPGDVMGSLTANDPNWAADGLGNSPWVGGCTYVYLKIEYNTNLFPGEPEIRLTVNGKNDIWDPRTSTRGFTSNWALIAADVITDIQFGLGDDTVNQAQLIAAANVCDEQVPLAIAPGGLTEARYTTNYHCDTSTTPGDVLATMLPGAAGRLSQIGGEWYLWPAYWQGPSFQFDESVLTDEPKWVPYRSYRDLFNRVNGTYIAPTYPFNIAGNLYDQNGFYNGMAQNNFPFAFQPTNFPQYAQDPLHGYASDQWLNEDGGRQLTKELSLQTVLSVTQAQRVAKITLLRNRQQGSGSFEMNLSALIMQPLDVMQFTLAQTGWTEKTLEVTGFSFRIQDSKGNGGAQSITCGVNVQETDISVYEWSTVEELTVADAPASATQTSYNPAPPTSMSLTSGAGTAVVNLDGTVQPRIEVQWDTPLDVLTKQIQIQYQQVSPLGPWISAPPVDVALNLGFITGVVVGQQYNVRIRSARANGAVSDWEEIDGYTVSITLSVFTSLAVAPPGTLIGEAFTDGTAAIVVEPFTALVGAASVSCLPGGEFTISALAQTTLYWVYYIDPTFAGGAITPIATTNSTDFLGKLGYFLIGSIVTPFAGSGGGGSPGTRYSPSSFSDIGSRTTKTPYAAYDGDVTTKATVSATAVAHTSTPTTKTEGTCTWAGFPSIVTSAVTTLSVIAAVSMTLVGTGSGQADISASITGTVTSLLSTTSNASSTTYTLSVPSGTDLSTISVTISATALATTGTTDSAQVNITDAEIWIQ
jgi:hypothetical protein